MHLPEHLGVQPFGQLLQRALVGLRDPTTLQWYVLFPMFALLCIMILVEGIKDGQVARDRAIAMLIIGMMLSIMPTSAR